MFEDIAELWRAYLRAAPPLTSEDPRWWLAHEVRTRLAQLDVLLNLVKEEIRMQHQDGPEDDDAFEGSWMRTELFTEAFYYFAWRLVEVFNGDGPFRFQGLPRIKAEGVRTVRNHVIEHPEKHQSIDLRRDYGVSDAGPSLKASALVVVSDSRSGETAVFPAKENLDRGLYVNARELRNDLLESLQKAVREALGDADHST